MNAIRSHYLIRRTCLLLVFVMLSSLLPMGLITGAYAQGRKTVLVFPLQNSAENSPVELGRRATSALTMAVSDVPQFDALQFSTTSPSVRRAVSEGRVRQVDVDEGSGDLATSLVIGAALQVDYIVTGSVQSFNINDAGAVEVLLSGQMYDVARNINPATGEPIAEPQVLKAFGVSGASTTRVRPGVSEDSAIQEAVRDAAAKAAATLSGRADVVEIAAKKREGGNYKWVLFALLLGALALGVNNGNGSAAPSASADAFPPRNVVLEENQSAINVSWSPPTGTTLTLARYFIERAIDGAPFQRIDQNSVPASATFFNDFGTIAGRHTYQYRIQAFYTNNTVSPFAVSGALTVTR
ncbi:MAG: fibronectin type III domain-containing protein [Bacteroidota bacterium]